MVLLIKLVFALSSVGEGPTMIDYKSKQRFNRRKRIWTNKEILVGLGVNDKTFIRVEDEFTLVLTTVTRKSHKKSFKESKK